MYPPHMTRILILLSLLTRTLGPMHPAVKGEFFGALKKGLSYLGKSRAHDEYACGDAAGCVITCPCAALAFVHLRC